MIPCPVCLIVLDGGGGRCANHERWFHLPVWIPAGEEASEKLHREEAITRGITSDMRAQLLSTAYAEAGSAFYERVRLAITGKASELRRLGLYDGPIHLGFRHFREAYGDNQRGSLMRSAWAIVGAILDALGLVAADQVEGVAHLFYELGADELTGPATPTAPGLQVVIYGRGPLG